MLSMEHSSKGNPATQLKTLGQLLSYCLAGPNPSFYSALGCCTWGSAEYVSALAAASWETIPSQREGTVKPEEEEETALLWASCGVAPASITSSSRLLTQQLSSVCTSSNTIAAVHPSRHQLQPSVPASSAVPVLEH